MISFLTWGAAFSFPYFLRSDHLFTWALMTGVFLLLPVIVMILKKQMIIGGLKKNKLINAQPKKELNLEPEMELKEEPKTELVIEPWPDMEVKPNNWITTLLEETVRIETPSLCFEQLVEKGFEAKEREEYQQAADYFYSALKTEPSPDITYYLITDSYRLWESVDLAEAALLKLVPFIHKFQNEAPKVWKDRLAKWLVENEIHLSNYRRKE